MLPPPVGQKDTGSTEITRAADETATSSASDLRRLAATAEPWVVGSHEVVATAAAATAAAPPTAAAAAAAAAAPAAPLLENEHEFRDQKGIVDRIDELKLWVKQEQDYLKEISMLQNLIFKKHGVTWAQAKLAEADKSDKSLGLPNSG